MSWGFRGMTLRKRLLATYLVLATLGSFTGLVGYLQLKSLLAANENVHYGNDLAHEFLDWKTVTLNWELKALEDLRSTKTQLSVGRDDRNCGLGKWLYGDHRRQAEARIPFLADYFRRVEEPHKRQHAAVAELERLLSSGADGRTRAMDHLTGEVHTEIVGLAALFDEMRARINEYNEQVEHAAEASTSRAIIAMLIAIFGGFAIAAGIGLFFSKYMAQTIGNIAAKLTHGADLVGSTSRAVFTSSESLAASVAQQAAALEETAAAVEELTATVNKNNETATRSRETSAQNATAAETGKTTVESMIRAIEEIDHSNAEISTAIQCNSDDIAQIVKVISAIGDKTKVINDIVFQTKLLSFNASVEAARAGEAGKGFAVVAEEVGNLAQMSGNAAAEIATMLEQSIRQVQELADATKAKIEKLVQLGKLKVEQGVTVAKQCGQALDTVVLNVRNVDQLIEGIATASLQQLDGIKEIGKSMVEMEKANQTNSQAAAQTSTSALELSGEADTQRVAVNELLCVLHGANCVQATAEEGSLNFDAAIAAHVEWKIKLKSYMANPDRSFDPVTVGKDNACALGKWLYGHGQEYSQLPEYTRLQEQHAKFHKCAAHIIELIDARDVKRAETLLRPGGELLSISTSTVDLIQTMKQKVALDRQERQAA